MEAGDFVVFSDASLVSESSSCVPDHVVLLVVVPLVAVACDCVDSPLFTTKTQITVTKPTTTPPIREATIIMHTLDFFVEEFMSASRKGISTHVEPKVASTLSEL